jgi:hypothetical protein
MQLRCKKRKEGKEGKRERKLIYQGSTCGKKTRLERDNCSLKNNHRPN